MLPVQKLYPGMTRRPTAHLKRWLVKSLAFVVFTVAVLNPNLKRAVLQVQHTFTPEALIQTNFTALPAINAQLDRWVVGDRGQHSEARLVAKFVLRKIKYVTDYENWDNLEYWPTAEEVWSKRQEDCDGRAILATSILRSRGFPSARMVVGLDHMWIRVNENEKNPSKPPHFVALLSPNPNFSLELHERSKALDWVRLAKALLHPAALRDTLTALFAEIPPLRKAVLVTLFLLLCYHPCRYSQRLLIVVALGLGAVSLLHDWYPARTHSPEAIAASALLSMAVAGALLAERFSKAKPARLPSTSFPVQEPAAG
jgi:hypothetical protein